MNSLYSLLKALNTFLCVLPKNLRIKLLELKAIIRTVGLCPCICHRYIGSPYIGYTY